MPALRVQIPQVGTDTFYDLAMKGSTLKQDPTAGMQNFKDGESTTTIYVRGCCGSRTPLIHPDNRMLMKWIMLGIFFVLYEVFLTPYRMCFNAPAKGVFFAFECVVNLFFMVDVVVNFFISFRNDEGEVVTDHGNIIKKYVTGWSRRAAAGRAQLLANFFGGAVWGNFRENANCGDPPG